jgi:DNA-binding SARP family transcriptional activator
MSERVRLELLGGLRVCLADGRSCALPTRKSEALLAYLALPLGRFHPRDTMAALLWGDASEPHARHSFRQALASVRRELGRWHPDIVLTQGDTVALNPQALTVDVADLEVACSEAGVSSLEGVAVLYKGDFLAGVRINEPPFEEWRAVERERLHELALEALARLLREQVRADRVESAIQTALRILAMDALQESVHRTLIRLLVRQGRRAAALQQYQSCVASLQRELGTEPEEETRQLYREILRTTGTVRDRGPAATRPPETPMVGRDIELNRMRGSLARMLDDGGHILLVTGEAGIGKSRLIEELVTSATASGAHVGIGRCRETEQTLPLQPWIDAIRNDAPLLTGIRDRLGTTALSQLAPVLPELRASGVAAVTAATPALLFDPMLELMGALASERPVVIVVEDLHWADTMSARLLAFLARRIHRWPVLIVGSLRPEELIDAPVLAPALEEVRDEGRLEEIHVGALSREDTGQLIRALQPSPRSDDEPARLTDAIWTASEGNPFVIVESIRGLRQDTATVQAAGLQVGRRVHEIVAARLERLAGLPRHCVTVAAAIGREFAFTLLPRAAGVTEREAADVVEELVRRRVLDSVGDRLDFCHDWIRLVAYERLLPPRRALVHAAIGEALEELHRGDLDEVADQLGTHYARAGDFRKAIPHLMRFGELAAQRYAFEDAARALAQAMAGADRLPPSDRDRCRLQVALRQAFVLSIQGHQREVLHLLQAQATNVKRVADAALASEYYFRLGMTFFYLGDHAHGVIAAQQALEEGERITDEEPIGKALHVLSLFAYDMGRPQDGIAYARRALPLLDQPHTQHWLGLVYQDLAVNYLIAGDLEDALETARHVEVVGSAAAQPRILAFSAFIAAWVHALRGDAEVAITTAQRALDVSRDATVTAVASGILGYAFLEAGDADAALALLTQVVDRMKASPLRQAELRNMTFLGEAQLVTRDLTGARETTMCALKVAEAHGMPLSVGAAQRLLGRIAQAHGQHADAERYLVAALQTYTECGARFEAARTCVDLAATLGARGNRDAARAHLASALGIFAAARAPRRTAAVHALARSLDVELDDGSRTAA